MIAVLSLAFAADASAAGQMRFACAEEDGGVMRYVKRARACDDSDRLIRFRRERVMTCAHQGGYVYLVRKRAACKRERHWPSLALRVPGAGPRSFCANRRTGLLRSTRHLPYDQPRPTKPGLSACKSNEKRLVVRPWNKRPNAVADAATVAADGPAPIDVLANDSDPEGAELAVARVIPGAIRGSVEIAADGGSVTYDPSGRFDSLGAGATATERFRYAASDGRRRDRARVTVTVTGVNEAPRAGADGAGTNEDTATNISVLGNDSDGDAGDVLRVTAVDRTGTAGTVAINPNGTLRYDPAGQFEDLAAGASRTDSFAYTVSDGHGGTASGSVTVTVSGINDAPVLDATDSDLGYTEGDGLVAVDPGIAVTDVDSAMLAGATVRIASNFTAAEDELAFTDLPGITGAYNDATGMLTLLGSATVAQYQAALRAVTYENSADTPSTATRTVTFAVTDAGALTSAPESRDVAVAPSNDRPEVTLSGGDTPYTEQAPATPIDSGLSVTDSDDTHLEAANVVIIDFDGEDEFVFSDQNGITGTISGQELILTGTATVADYETALRSVGFRHVGDNPAPSRSVLITVHDGDNGSPLVFRTITITPVNDPPEVFVGDDAEFTEDGGPVFVDPGVVVRDRDSTMLTGASVAITSPVAGESLAFTPQHGITGTPGGDTLTLSGTATLAQYEDVLRSVTYDNSSQNPPNVTRILSFVVTDAGGLPSEPSFQGVDITPVNDAPVVTTSAGSTPYTENAVATPVDSGLTVADVDDAGLEGATVEIVAPQTGDQLLFTDQSGITGTGSGTASLTLMGTATRRRLPDRAALGRVPQHERRPGQHEDRRVHRRRRRRRERRCDEGPDDHARG